MANFEIRGLKREHWKDAAEHCRIVATEDPANAKALFRWAKARLGDGDYEAAIEKLEAAQKLVRLSLGTNSKVCAAIVKR